MNTISLAYMLVALCHYQQAADDCVQRLNLPCPAFADRNNIVEFNTMGGVDRLDGYIESTNFVFHFEPFGKIDRISKKPSSVESKTPSQKSFDMNRAGGKLENPEMYAEQMLAYVGVDLVSLGEFKHESFSMGGAPTMIPKSQVGGTTAVAAGQEYWITWGENDPRLERYTPYAAQIGLAGNPWRVIDLAVYDASLYKTAKFEVPGALVLQDLPDAPFVDLWNNPNLSATNVYQLLHVSKAYRWVVRQRMLAVADQYLSRLNLPAADLFPDDDKTEDFVIPPALGFNGCLSRAGLLVQFDSRGQIKYIFFNKSGGDAAGIKLNGSANYQNNPPDQNLIASNAVAALAVGWLDKLEINVQNLNSNAIPAVRFTSSKNSLANQFWWVSWYDRSAGQHNKPLLYIGIDAVTKSLNRIKFNASDYCPPQSIKIKNGETLMKMSDEDFDKLSEAKRHALLAQFEGQM